MDQIRTAKTSLSVRALHYAYPLLPSLQHEEFVDDCFGSVLSSSYFPLNLPSFICFFCCCALAAVVIMVMVLLMLVMGTGASASAIAGACGVVPCRRQRLFFDF